MYTQSATASATDAIRRRSGSCGARPNGRRSRCRTSRARRRRGNAGERPDCERGAAQRPRRRRSAVGDVVDVVGGDVLEVARRAPRAAARSAAVDVAEADSPVRHGTRRPARGQATNSTPRRSIGRTATRPRAVSSIRVDHARTGVARRRLDHEDGREAGVSRFLDRLGRTAARTTGGSSAYGSWPRSIVSRVGAASTARPTTTSRSRARSRRRRSTCSRRSSRARPATTRHRRVQTQERDIDDPAGQAAIARRATAALGKMPARHAGRQPDRTAVGTAFISKDGDDRPRHRAVRHAGAGPRRSTPSTSSKRPPRRPTQAGRASSRTAARSSTTSNQPTRGQRRPHRPARRGRDPAVRVRLGGRDGPSDPHRAVRARRRHLAHHVVAAVTDIGTLAPTLATMIGLGVGIDYSLFIVTRYRENLAAGMDVEAAVGHSVATAGSGGAVRGQHRRHRDLRPRDRGHPVRRHARLHVGARRRGDDGRRDHAAPRGHRPRRDGTSTAGGCRSRPSHRSSRAAHRHRRSHRCGRAGPRTSPRTRGPSRSSAWSILLALAWPVLSHAARRVRRRQPAHVDHAAPGLRPIAEGFGAGHQRPAARRRAAPAGDDDAVLDDDLRRRSRRTPGVASVAPAAAEPGRSGGAVLAVFPTTAPDSAQTRDLVARPARPTCSRRRVRHRACTGLRRRPHRGVHRHRRPHQRPAPATSSAPSCCCRSCC